MRLEDRALILTGEVDCEPLAGGVRCQNDVLENVPLAFHEPDGACD